MQKTEKRQVKVNVYLYEPEVGFTGAPLTFQSDLNLQENAWEQRITHTICKHIKILRTLAFVRNFVNSCQIKLISVRQYNNTPYK